eukprot:5930616-Pleurochrysis_carterae.AAC.1
MTGKRQCCGPLISLLLLYVTHVPSTVVLSLRTSTSTTDDSQTSSAITCHHRHLVQQRRHALAGLQPCVFFAGPRQCADGIATCLAIAASSAQNYVRNPKFARESVAASSIASIANRIRAVNTRPTSN